MSCISHDLTVPSSLRAQDFNDKSYWAGPLLSLQKVTVAGVLVFYEPSYTQTLAGLLIAMWWAIMIACLFPYRSLGENLCASVLNCSVSMIMVGVIASRLLDEGAELERSFASSVLWLSVVMAFGAIVAALGVEWAYGDWRGAFRAEEKNDEKDTGAEAESGEETKADACAESEAATVHIVTTPVELEASEPQVLRF